MYYVISGHHQVYHWLPDHGLYFYMTRNPHMYNDIANSNDTLVNFNNFRMNGCLVLQLSIAKIQI